MRPKVTVYCVWSLHVHMSFLKSTVSELGCLIFPHFSKSLKIYANEVRELLRKTSRF